MQSHAAEPSRRGKRKSESVARNPAHLLAQARAAQVRQAQGLHPCLSQHIN